MTNEQVNKMYVIAVNRNSELIYYQQASYLDILVANGCREPKIIKVVPNRAKAIGFVRKALMASLHPNDASYDQYRYV